MNGKAGLIAVDWGTTNRRIYVLGADGVLEARAADGFGILKVTAGGFPAEVAALRIVHGERPMLLAGMIGSNRGWVEAGYVDCPADLGALVRGLEYAGEGASIVPGVRDLGEGRADVMRGEEVQLLGAAAAGLIAPDARVCHPGTHAKWARMEAGAIAAFRTVMTGELFALLKAHSIMAGQLDGMVADCPVFRAGVRRSLEAPELSADLFGVRAQLLLGKLAPADGADYASGLLIGADIVIGLRFVGPGAISLIGEPALTRLYAAALDEAGRGHASIDGERAFLAGIAALAREIA
jgi:2-dehydro-3-deoxygalactonokinase